MTDYHDFRRLRKLLETHSWQLVRINGSHHIFQKEGEENLVIPAHRGRVNKAYVRIVKKWIKKTQD